MKKIYFLVLALGLFTSVNAQTLNFLDQNLENSLVEGQNLATYFFTEGGGPILIFDPQNPNAPGFSSIDFNSNFKIDDDEAAMVYELRLNIDSVSSLSGLNQFPNLRKLFIYGNATFLQSLDLGGITPTIKDLIVESNLNFSTLNLNHYPNLESLLTLGSGFTTIAFHANNFTSIKNYGAKNNSALNFSFLNSLVNLNSLELENCQINSTANFNNLHGLIVLNLGGNLFTSIDFTPFPNLTLLQIYSNSLTNINVSSLTNLRDLSVYNNELTELNLEGLSHLESLNCTNNQITMLDLDNFRLTNLQCANNLLTNLSIKNGANIIANGYFYFNNNPELRYICADEADLLGIQNKINDYGYTNCHVNSYCSFTPGGTYYTIQGNNKFDENNNGCDASDIALPNLKFNITNGSINGSLISDTSGNYLIPVQAGTHTITPVFEDPTYFTVSPSSVNATFPTQVSPFTQNFCITANGVHPDLEVSVLPIQPARPGFEAKYKLVYKNKGNTTQSGTINFVFNDAVLDFVSASPIVATQTVNNLSWSFTNLLPFETREITFTLNVNSPMETPAVNNGDVLNYTVTVSSVATDDMPNDNTFVFNQAVVNSYDPNDKTCLEGATIPPSKVGDYVHYMIRFENNGTANAQNIVVKDMIDTNKFDINSLVLIKGSHSFVTNISAGNKVEFIFENINLPFDDANNDGYVAFKIKTKPTLTNGDTFSNTASIYFDYNFPIVTNTATTTIQALSRQDFEFSNYFNLYPNPVSTTLNIDAKDTIQISSINIYNTLGQLVLVVPNAQNLKTVDVSNLSSGNYFIKINSDKGTSNTKFIKQ